MYYILTADLIKSFVLGLPTWVIVLFCIIAFMGVVGQWALYSKCNLPGYAALVPVWNVQVFLSIVGRPQKQKWMVMVPPVVALTCFLFIPDMMIGGIIAGVSLLPWCWFMIKIFIEVAKCFGKKETSSFILIVLLNGMYLFNLALSQEEKYLGPVYKEGENPGIF
jgi:hypothetical protein